MFSTKTKGVKMVFFFRGKLNVKYFLQGKAVSRDHEPDQTSNIGFWVFKLSPSLCWLKCFIFRDEGEGETTDCPLPPPDPENLDPRMFAPTGDVYSYFQRRRTEPLSYCYPLLYSTRKCLGGRMLKSSVY